MSNIETILIELEQRCRMKISAPASKEAIMQLQTEFPSLPEEIIELYGISDGIELNAPGTVFYPIDKIKSINKPWKENDFLDVGMFNFGDPIVVSNEGKLLQLDHETGEVFLDWNTLEEFLQDEKDSLE